ncbi:hypothetical protein [Streptomyces sudanensis]|uniref:hypothetical protein n=1 Tax=Streptomyces sudanensis TaxID=436397 RepID=UPI0020CDEE70|nr:hypothetical protein [Streptomyces sudanensis]MCP9959178.1 hypothetical protein [Streptomyces sudanensis]MCQ0000362.1 hypothetical protein [Streptomyces sudanensis]
MTSPDTDVRPAGRPAGPWPRRLLRNRTVRAVAAATLAGALLGAGVVGWRTGTLPFGGPRPCWDSLSTTALDALMGAEGRREVEEEALHEGVGRCRIRVFDTEGTSQREVSDRLDVEVREFDPMSVQGTRAWADEFLTSAMTPLGDGLSGMASRTGAWLALPQSCVGREPFVVVQARTDDSRFEHYAPERRRADLARVVVEAANGVLGDYGCTGRYRLPRTAPAPMEWRESDPAALCGLPGVAVPRKRPKFETERIGPVGGPVRVCAARRLGEESVRLTTVTDPRLAELLGKEVFTGGPSVAGKPGHGSYAPARAVYRVGCQTGDVVFLVEQLERMESGYTLVRGMLAPYVASEAHRLGCGPVEVGPVDPRT